MSSKKTDAQHIFEKWCAELRNKDRKWAAVRGNFEELFYELWNNDVPFDEAHEYIRKAANKHAPPLGTAKNAYETVKKSEHFVGESFQEWLNNWKKGIEDQAIEAFYSMYTPPSLEKKKEETSENRYGSMDPVEYRKQRRYAESFPILFTEQLEKDMESGHISSYEDFAKGLEDILEKSKKDEQ